MERLFTDSLVLGSTPVDIARRSSGFARNIARLRNLPNIWVATSLLCDAVMRRDYPSKDYTADVIGDGLQPLPMGGAGSYNKRGIYFGW